MSIPEEEIEVLREEQLKFLPDSDGIIKRKSYVQGEEQFAYDTIASDVSYRLTPGFGLWRSVADRYQGVTAFTGTFPYGTDIKAADKFIAGVRTFEVRDTLGPKGYSTAVRVLLDLVTD